jgi:hypothetical protein
MESEMEERDRGPWLRLELGDRLDIVAATLDGMLGVSLGLGLGDR